MEPNPYTPPAIETNVDADIAYEDYRRRIETQQARVNRLLTRGIVFSVVWLVGFGSLYSVFLAAQAHRIIRAHDGVLGGMKRIWWCYIVGGFGIVLLGMVLVAVLFNG